MLKIMHIVSMPRYSAFNFSFHKLCLILKDWYLIRFPPNFQERFLMPSANPEFVFGGLKIQQFCFKGSVERSRHKRHFCSLLSYFLLS